jgi:hypothetical protein
METYILQTNSLDKRPRGPKGASSWLLSMMSTRSWHAGEVAGITLARTESSTSQMTLEERDKVVDKLIEAVHRACQDRDDIAHRGALWRATALLIDMPGKFASTIITINKQIMCEIYIFISLISHNLCFQGYTDDCCMQSHVHK